MLVYVRKCNSLKCDLFRCNLISSCNCDCENYIESVDHFFLKCNIYTEHRIQLFLGMNNLSFDIGIENMLFGNASFENDKNINCSCSSKNTFLTLKDLSSKFIY